jgi:peptide/nickel transport system permease protein
VETTQEARPRKGRAGAFAKALGRFLFAAVTTYFGLLAVTFFIGRVVPIDPVLAILGDRAPAHVVERVRREMGFDLPLYEQFYIYIKGILSGDFGNSVLTTNPVMVDIRRAFPATVELATLGTLIGACVGVPLGVLAAVRRGSIADQVVRVVGLIGYSVPIFWLALISLVIFYAQLRWVAFPGRIDIVFEYTFTPITGFYLLDSAWQGQWDVFYDVFRHIILPASLLGYFSLAYISRMTRSFMIEQLSQEYVVTARVKGLSWSRTVWGHAFRNIAVQVVTVVALSYAFLLEGAVLTETVFAWPGFGRYLTNALLAGDMNAVVGCTLLVGVIFVTLNLLCDLLYRVFDPRTR